MEGGLLKRYVKDKKKECSVEKNLIVEGRWRNRCTYARQRKCFPLQEIETKVMAQCRYQLMEAMGGGIGVVVLLWGCGKVEQFTL